ncbi:hypothetical protein BMF94_0989 [Rhodotorula taiwanensis]|uniref:Uncharacterized protein n=1 Tax=Rhodotorula taiwanensis TaxID=741276 RepID=A0A2S5BGK8_9BASI|nr:hypothetical protein BMF94_0989 [Rhodotorula taiwanensis]
MPPRKAKRKRTDVLVAPWATRAHSAYIHDLDAAEGLAADYEKPAELELTLTVRDPTLEYPPPAEDADPRLKRIYHRTCDAFPPNSPFARVPQQPRRCQGAQVVNTAAARLGDGSFSCRDLYMGRIETVTRTTFDLVPSPEEAKEAILDREAPFVILSSVDDANNFKLMHGDGRHYYLAMAQGKSYLAEHEQTAVLLTLSGPTDADAITVLFTPESWRDDFAYLRSYAVQLAPDWRYNGPAQMRKQLDASSSYSPELGKALHQILAPRLGAAEPSSFALDQLDPAFARPLARALDQQLFKSLPPVRQTTAGEPHLLDVKRSIELPLVNTILQTPLLEAVRQTEAFVQLVPYERSGSTKLIGGYVRLLPKNTRYEAFTAAHCGLFAPSPPGSPATPLRYEPKQGRLATTYDESVYYERGTSKDGGHMYYELGLLGAHGQVGAVDAGSFFYDTSTHRVTPLNQHGTFFDTTISLDSVLKSSSLMNNILILRACFRIIDSEAATEDTWAVKMNPSYAPPKLNWDPASALSEYAHLYELILDSPLPAFPKAWPDFARTIEDETASMSSGSVAPGLVAFLLESAATKLGPDQIKVLQEEHSYETRVAAARNGVMSRRNQREFDKNAGDRGSVFDELQE